MYHYETLDKANGSFKKAIEIFKNELHEFRKVSDIKTICMHGNPLKPWSNRDLWTRYDFRDFGILGEPYLSIDYRGVLYLTDTGRRWDGKYSVKDAVATSSPKIKNTNNLISLIKNGKIQNACLVVHPNRWNDDFVTWSEELIFQNLKNLGKVGILFYRSAINNSAHQKGG